MNLSLLCTSLLILLYCYLSLNVSKVRGIKRKTNERKEILLAKAVRAHGNASEYIPVFIIAMLFYRDAGSWIIGALAIIATLGRFSHAVGMLTAEHANQKNPFRYWGALATYIALLGFGGVFLIDALSAYSIP